MNDGHERLRGRLRVAAGRDLAPDPWGAADLRPPFTGSPWSPIRGLPTGLLFFGTDTSMSTPPHAQVVACHPVHAPSAQLPPHNTRTIIELIPTAWLHNLQGPVIWALWAELLVMHKRTPAGQMQPQLTKSCPEVAPGPT